MKKRILASLLSVLLFFPLLVACSPDHPLLQQAWERTKNATSMRIVATVTAESERGDSASISYDLRVAENADSTIGAMQGSVNFDFDGDSGTFNVWMDYDVSNLDNPELRFVMGTTPAMGINAQFITLDFADLDDAYIAEIMEAYREFAESPEEFEELAELILDIFLSNLDWRQVSSRFGFELNAERVRVILTEILRALNMEMLGMFMDIPDMHFEFEATVAGGFISSATYSFEMLGMSANGTMQFSDFNRPFTVTFPTTTRYNSVSVFTLQDFSPIHIWTNGRKMNIPWHLRPHVRYDRTMIPVRLVVERMGGEVGWEAETQTVVVTISGQTVSFRIGSDIATLSDGRLIQMDVAPFLYFPPGSDTAHTFIPLRAMSESLGRTVDHRFITYVYGAGILEIFID